METFLPSYTSLEELREIQLKGLQWSVQHAYHGSEVYRQKFDKAGIAPADIKDLDDLRKLPLSSSQDLAEGYPFPFLSVPIDEVVRLHTSSGTTGKRKVLCYTKKDIEDWTHFFARCFEVGGLSTEDRIQICVGYGLWTAGIGFQLACEKFGAMAVPVGPGNLEMQMEFLMDFESTVICCTASMGLLLAEEVERKGLRDRVSLKKMIYGSERSSDAMRQRIKSILGLSDMYDIPGMTELYGPGTGMECSMHEGMHYWADYYILEIIDPETLLPVPNGEIGEMVVSTLQKEAVPLIRYRTRDISYIIKEPCPCGLLIPRHGRLLGRTDDMFIIRGVNIFPSQIDSVLREQDGIGSEYQVYLDRSKEGKDSITLRIESASGSDASADYETIESLRHMFKNKLFVTPQIEMVEYGTLPRSERKTQRVFDRRSGE
ncbi:MAG: phenylacetate--CoA ligase [SAR324 cluster bacterium]|nr:phenylacetate--CoA ligase [SAR324 cluster bacterium]